MILLRVRQCIPATYDGEANDGTLTISGGTFTSTGSHAVALLTSGAKADITGGTFDAGAGSYGVSGVEGASAQISAGTYKVDDAEKICNLPNALVPSYGAVQGEDGNFTVQVTDGEAVVIENGVTTLIPHAESSYGGCSDWRHRAAAERCDIGERRRNWKRFRHYP
ncbi:hypothetical protein [Ruthenibacterium lactatiformans]|uniref:hypothetical protein n=1 Tax=Ruthenibacterium lactatiformans TaxID=1550024 RepID=UPI00352280BC